MYMYWLRVILNGGADVCAVALCPIGNIDWHAVSGGPIGKATPAEIIPDAHNSKASIVVLLSETNKK